MRIGIDLRSLEGGIQHRGIGRYATQLIEALSTIDDRNKYTFFVSHPNSLPPAFNLAKAFRHTTATGEKLQLRRKLKFIRTLHLTPQPLDIDKFGLDVFFHIDVQQPIKNKSTPVVSVLFDIIPFLHKKEYQHVHFGSLKPADVVFYSRLKLKWQIAGKRLHDYKKAAAVVSISEYSKKDLLKFLPDLDPKKIETIPLAASEPPHVDTKAIKKMEALKLKNFLFYVGGADPRKGLVGLVEEMESVWRKYPDTQLVLAGKEITDPEVPEAVKLAQTVASSSKPQQIKLLGFITDGELAWLYRNAAALVFPSSYEGFGLPILEAMQMGTPVIAYDNSSIPEVAGKAAILVENGAPLAPHINELIGNKRLQKDLASKGLKQEKLFTWKKTAQKTLRVLEEAARQKV